MITDDTMKCGKFARLFFADTTLLTTFRQNFLRTFTFCVMSVGLLSFQQSGQHGEGRM